MSGPLARSALVLALPVATLLAVAGAMALGGPGLIALLVAAGLVGATAAGTVRELVGAEGSSAVDVGVRTAGWAAGGLVVLAGTAALAGGGVAVIAGLLALAVACLVVFRRRAAALPALRPVPVRRPSAQVRTSPSDGPMMLLLPPVGGSTAEALGQEWLRTTAVLTGRLDPVLRRALVARRAAVLDELERRDPTGFRRWLAAEPLLGGNPAQHVRDLPPADADAA